MGLTTLSTGCPTFPLPRQGPSPQTALRKHTPPGKMLAVPWCHRGSTSPPRPLPAYLNELMLLTTKSKFLSLLRPPLCPGDPLLGLLSLPPPPKAHVHPLPVSRAELQERGCSGRPQGLGSFFTSLIQAGGKFWGVKCFPPGKEQSSRPFANHPPMESKEMQSQRV